MPEDYVKSLRRAVSAVVGADHDGTHFSVERFYNSSFEEQFVAMMQADVLVGSGSSVPQVAALLSPADLFQPRRQARVRVWSRGDGRLD